MPLYVSSRATAPGSLAQPPCSPDVGGCICHRDKLRSIFQPPFCFRNEGSRLYRDIIDKSSVAFITAIPEGTADRLHTLHCSVYSSVSAEKRHREIACFVLLFLRCCDTGAGHRAGTSVRGARPDRSRQLCCSCLSGDPSTMELSCWTGLALQA